MVKKKKPRKGFNRSAKEWEKSIATHIGKVIDNLKAEDILNLTAASISALAGYLAGKRLNADEMTSAGMAASSLLAYQLSKAPNLVAGASGVAYLSSLGLISAWDPISGAVQKAGVAPSLAFGSLFGAPGVFWEYGRAAGWW